MKKLIKEGWMDVPRELKDFEEKIHFWSNESVRRDPHQHARARAKASLKDTYDEALDILDEVEYEAAAKKVKRDNRALSWCALLYLSTFN